MLHSIKIHIFAYLTLTFDLENTQFSHPEIQTHRQTDTHTHRQTDMCKTVTSLANLVGKNVKERILCVALALNDTIHQKCNKCLLSLDEEIWYFDWMLAFLLVSLRLAVTLYVFVVIFE